MISKIEKIESFDDRRGSLLPFEFNNLDFEVKRVFIVSQVPNGEIRGNHSHYKTKQYIICISGTVNVILDNGVDKETHTVNKNEAILVPELVWDSQEFLSDDATILVACSTEFNLDDYIFDYTSFLKAIDDAK
jgi:dTDP-4-dehydrorhamnose 3,5-epimerase-like enzyme